MLTPQIEAALSLQQFFETRGWKWCVIGGLAVQRWGQPRQTLDADVGDIRPRESPLSLGVFYWHIPEAECRLTLR